MNALDILQWLWDLYLSATLLLGAVLLACVFAGQPARRMALSWATAAGLILLAILSALPNWSQVHLLPPTPSAATAADAPPLVARVDDLTASPVIEPQANPPAVQAIPQAVRINWGTVMLCGLALGSGVTLLWLTLGAWQVRRLCAGAQPAPPDVLALFSGLSPHSSIRMGVLTDLPVAVAVGLSRPMILLPRALVTNAGREQLRSVLAHELAHIEHRDLWLLAILRALMVLLWPHPLFWLLRRQVRTDQEILADIAAAEVTTRGRYAEQLVTLARSAVDVRVPRLSSSVGLWERPSQLATRVKLLLDEKLTILRRCSRRWRVGTAIALAGFALTLSLVTLSPAEPTKSEQPQAAKEEVKTKPAPAAATSSATDRQRYAELRKLAKPNTILGFCFDENGQPLEGVEVDLYVRNMRGKVGELIGEPLKVQTITSDREGKFAFENVVDIAKEFPEGFKQQDAAFLPENARIFAIVGRKKGRVKRSDSSTVAEVAQSGHVAVLQMPRGQTLRGRVIDEFGHPVEGARVGLGRLPAGTPSKLFTTNTDRNGEFFLTDLDSHDAAQAKEAFEKQNGKWQPDPRFRDWVPWERTLTISQPKFVTEYHTIDKIPDDIEVSLEAGKVLTGRIFKHGEPPEPAAEVDVTVRSYPRTTPDHWLTTRVQTNAEGTYRIEELEEGKHVVYVNAPEWFAPPIDLDVRSGKINQAPDIVLTQGGRVRIHLIDDKTGGPLTLIAPTSGFVVPQPQPSAWDLRFTSTAVEFSREGIGEQRMPAGKYHFLVKIPGTDNQDGFKDAIFSRIRHVDDVKQLPVYEVVEGEVRDIEVRMIREEKPARATAALVPAE